MGNFDDLVWILYSLVMTTLGHSLYRNNKRLGLKPIYNRILFGFMGSSLYVGGHLFITKDQPTFNYINMLLLFIVGYYVEPLTHLIDERLPYIVDRLVDRLLPKIPTDPSKTKLLTDESKEVSDDDKKEPEKVDEQKLHNKH